MGSIDMNKNRENFIKYSNDLYFHHLSVENKRIRALSKQQILDIQDRLFDYTSIEKLKNSVKKHQ